MALILADRVKETTTTTGTGTVTLLGASTGFQSFSAIGNGNTTYYTIAGQTGSEWEVGIGTYTSAGTTLTRTTVLSSSNAGNLVTFSAGTKDVFVTYPSSKSVNLDTSGNVSALGTVASGTWNATTLAVAYGGTGLTSTPTNGQLNIGNGTGFTRATLTGTVSQVTVTNASGAITLSLPSTINVNTSGSAASLSTTLAIASGGTGQTTANAAFDALAPSQATNAGKYLTTNGTTTSWGTISATGTVTSVAATVPAFLSVTGSPITTSGTLAISYSGTALPVANGGTGATSASAARTSLGLVIGTDVLAPNGSAASLTSFPTLNQNTTGSAATVTGNATGSTFGFNSGYGSVATAYGCRAWVNFSGVASTSIKGSGNVSSVTYVSAGKYTINFTTAMTDANYCLALGGAGLGNSGGGKLLVENSSGTGGTLGRTASAVTVLSSYSFSNPGSGTDDNAYSNSVAVFR